ncbi:MAG: hypothetical protein ACTTJE_04935 [Schwartzia sp. (in: firmicutes)]
MMPEKDLAAIVEDAFKKQLSSKTYKDTIDKATCNINNQQSYADTILKGVLRMTQDALKETLSKIQ